MAPLDDDARQARLDKMRARATGLLVFAAAVFLVTRHWEPTIAYLEWPRAAAEAALVGGLADWFAVTALFRRPLGLPIPHTAIIVTQQERIGRVLGNFVQSHFLTRDVVSTELRQMRPAERAAKWLSVPENSARVAAQLSTGFVRALQAIPEEELRAVIRRAAVERLEKTHVAPILGDILTAVTTDDRHHELLDEALRVAVVALQDNRDSIRQQIGKERPWYLPRVVEDAIYTQVLRSAESLLAEVKENPQHPLRGKFDKAIGAFTEKLKHSPEVSAKADLIKSQVLSPAVVDDLVDGVWNSLRTSLQQHEAGAGTAPEGIEHTIRTAAGALLANEALLAELDEILIDSACAAVDRHREQIGGLIARTVQAWDPPAGAKRLELAVGSDLQYIRINGTIVGALAGLGIHAFSKIFS